MSSSNSKGNQQYWEENIEGFSGFYDTISEENIQGASGFTWLYKKFMFPIEKKYMMDRHKAVSDYINENTESGMKVADIGCGSGVYCKMMLERGVFVYGLDYAESAVKLTEKNLESASAEQYKIEQFDITSSKIPEVDAAISIGVLPYIADLDIYLDNVLPQTDKFLFNFLDMNHPLNRLRKSLPFFDVRSYSFHKFQDVKSGVEQRGFSIVRKTPLATGFILECKKNS
ncbi:MAG: methyltransferase domain-containing protein [Flavobacteriales bacterium]|nr:methyltransferase domain-containing protein [Flavobacteriales bacterium]